MRWLLLFLILIVGIAQSQERPPDNVQKNQGHSDKPHKQPKADNRGTQENPLIVKRMEAEETPEHKEKTANERSMIVWTKVLAGATIALAIIAVGQLVMFLKQLRLMKAGAKDTNDVAIAAKTQASALINSERARLFVEVFVNGNVVGASNGAKNIVRVKIWNYGKTAATITQIRAYCVIQKDHPTKLIEFSGSDRKLPPGLGLASNCAQEEMIEGKLTTNELQDIQAWQTNWFCVGRILYKDIFEETRETGFCWHYLYHLLEGKFVFDRESTLNKQT